MDDTHIDAFMQWFRSSGGTVDTTMMGITGFPGSGRGAIALSDIPVCALSIPVVVSGQLMLLLYAYHRHR